MSESIINCCFCDKEMEKWTPCCHEPLCEKCFDKMIAPECWICNDDSEICHVCAERNQYDCCQYCKKYVSCWCIEDNKHSEIQIYTCCKKRTKEYFKDLCKAYLSYKWLDYLKTMTLKEQCKYIMKNSKRKILRDVAKILKNYLT